MLDFKQTDVVELFEDLTHVDEDSDSDIKGEKSCSSSADPKADSSADEK